MKKVILTWILGIGIVFSSFGQLESKAKSLKEGAPDVYAEIRARGVEKWGDDHKMVTYEINGQADAIFELTLLTEGKDSNSIEVRTMVKAMSKWKDEINGEENYDWKMVLYEYKKQINAMDYYLEKNIPDYE